VERRERMLRRLAEKQRKIDLQLQLNFQHDNPCLSSPPPAQQCGGDDYLSDLGTPLTVVKKENDRRDSTRDPSLVRSSSAEFAQGQRKPKLRSTASIRTEDKVVDPLQSVCLCRSLSFCQAHAPLLFFTVGLGRKIN
jgi:hypothetical protein